MTEPKTIAIIGAGQAGAQAAQSLRQSGYDGRLLLIGDEPHAPYQRPPLSKKYLSGEFARDRLALLPDKFYSENAVECLFDARAIVLDANANQVKLSDGTTIAFDQALIATGSRSRAIPIAGAELDGVFSVRSIRDVDAISPHIRAGQRVLIIGAGYIGLEVAAVACGLGFDVRVVEAADRVMARTAPEVVSRHFEHLHGSNGITFDLGAGVQSISRATSGELTVATSAGNCDADWVLVAIGSQPNTELAESAGLATKDGITVNEFCRTSSPNIFAAGDCTNFPSARYTSRVRLESVQNAIDQAKAAALAMLGKGEAYDPVPWFWSDQYDTKIQIAGLSQFADEHVVRGDPAGGSFSVGHLRANKLVALDAINSPRDYMFARRMIAMPSEICKAALANPDVPLNEIIKQS